MSSFARSTLVLADSYSEAVVLKGIEEGLIQPIVDDELWETYINELTSMKKTNRKRRMTLQMLLLFEKTLLVDVSPGYDYSRLDATGLVETIPFSDDPYMMGLYPLDLATREYAMLLKPIVINYLVKNFEWLHPLRYGVPTKKGYSDLFDVVFSPSVNKNLVDLSLDDVFARVFPDSDIRKLRFHQWLTNEKFAEALGGEFDKENPPKWARDWSFWFRAAMGKLLSLLDYSVEDEAVLMQSTYGMGNREPESSILEGKQMKRLTDAYQILRISIESLIGKLPRVETISDVIRLKDKKGKDITRLREVLSGIELNLRDGRLTGLSKAMAEIEKATKELNEGEDLGKVNRWTTYLSLPVGVIEAVLGLPPVAGFTLGLVGAASTLKADRAKARNDWLQIVR